jgi:hypothetical protein
MERVTRSCDGRRLELVCIFARRAFPSGAIPVPECAISSAVPDKPCNCVLASAQLRRLSVIGAFGNC